MCFSATASFVAGGALTTAGVVTLTKVRTKREIPFALIPLLTGIQQIAEGFVWVSLQSGGEHLLNVCSTNIYFVFAHIWWPLFLPFAIWLIETDPAHRRLILLFEGIGIFVGAFFMYYMTLAPVASYVVGHSIVYTHPATGGQFLAALYALAICGSCLMSSKRIINMFGALLLVSFIIAALLYYAAFVSVWCFFAAVLSGIIYLYFVRR